MKKINILLSIISILTFSIVSIAQEEVKQDTIKQDTVKNLKSYGLRIGIDLSNPIHTIINNDRKSLEVVADYRIKKNLYIASEIGFLNRNEQEDYYNFITKGQYVKLGINYNTYKNWLNMDNEIYVGFRYGFSTFTQKVSNIIIEPNQILPPNIINENQEFSNLNANWFEFVAGFKVEIYPNIYLGTQFSLNKILSQKKPEKFKNLYIPGFNRVYINNGGFGFNYTISYRITLKKK